MSTMLTRERSGQFAPKPVNGLFLCDIGPRAADGPLAERWRKTIGGETTSLGLLQETLEELRAAERPVVVQELVGNTALRGLWWDGPELEGCNDTTSNKAVRGIGKYVTPTRTGRQGTLLDGTPVSLRGDIKGFEIKEKQGPVALVALDPTRLGEIDSNQREAHIVELEIYMAIMMNPGVPNGQKWDCAMSDEVKGILERTLAANDSYTEQSDAQDKAQQWPLPFDYIASLKALYVLLSHGTEQDDNFKDNSGRLRQGAVWLTNENGESIVVGCSGLDSALDEMIAGMYARETLGIESR